jgi:D-ribose pyranose/furanose isomerase RbsD
MLSQENMSLQQKLGTSQIARGKQKEIEINTHEWLRKTAKNCTVNV